MKSDVSSSVSLDSCSSGAGYSQMWLLVKLKDVYRPTWVKSKGAILVLFWSLLVNLNFYTTISGVSDVANSLNVGELLTYIITEVVIAVSTLFYPLAGWIADVHLGRYKTIKYSLWLMWFGLLILVIAQTVWYMDTSQPYIIPYAIVPLSCLITVIGNAGFQATVLPFGTDQLVDASGETISSFIHWQFWATFVSLSAVYHFLQCTSIDRNLLRIMQPLFQITGVSLTLCLDYVFKDCLVVERPQVQNPYQILAGVLKYAAKHKVPVRRSAFTFCESEIPSRLDLGKLQYGGPFTTEQVEDVKTFSRIILVLLSIGGGIFLSTGIYLSLAPFVDHLHHGSNDTHKTNEVLKEPHCSRHILLTNTYFFIVIIAVPFKEIVYYPFLWRWFPSILKRLGAAMVVDLTCVVTLILIDVIGDAHGDAQCFLSEDTATTTVSQYWILLPQFLYGVAYVSLSIATFEFIIAQSPYNMKGLIIGLFYSINGLATLIACLLVIPFSYGFTSDTSLGCGFWYLSILLVFAVFQLTTYTTIAKRYKKRRRDDITNEQMFAENYFSSRKLSTTVGNSANITMAV